MPLGIVPLIALFTIGIATPGTLRPPVNLQNTEGLGVLELEGLPVQASGLVVGEFPEVSNRVSPFRYPAMGKKVLDTGPNLPDSPEAPMIAVPPVRDVLEEGRFRFPPWQNITRGRADDMEMHRAIVGIQTIIIRTEGMQDHEAPPGCRASSRASWPRP